MHILEIPTFLPPYGGMFCVSQANALKAHGHEVRILCCQQLGLTIYPWHYITAPFGRHWTKIEGIETYKTNMRGLPLNIHINQKRWCKIVSELFNNYVQLYGKPDIIHAHCAQWAGVATRAISKRTGIPYFITEHLSAGMYQGEYLQWAKPLISEAYRDAEYVIPVAKELVTSLEPIFGEDYRWIEISNIIDTDFFKPSLNSDKNTKSFSLCCVANASKDFLYLKGYDVLAKAWKHFDNNMQLHIAGRNTRSKRMQSLFSDYKNVILHGELNREEVRTLLQHSNALVLPSRSEVQPLVLLEAMATGIPVISTEVTPSSERIPEACFIAKTGDADSLLEKIEEALRATISPSRLHDTIAAIASPAAFYKKFHTLLQPYDNHDNN